MLRRMKEFNSDSIVVACGCYAQVAKEQLEQMPEIDIVLGNKEKKDIVKYVDEFLQKRTDTNKKEPTPIDDTNWKRRNEKWK